MQTDIFTPGLSGTRYRQLCKGLTLAAKFCDSVQIVDGLIRQVSDEKTSILAVDFSKQFKINITLDRVRSALKKLKLFRNTADEIIIQRDNSGVIISDGITRVFVPQKNCISSQGLFLPDDVFEAKVRLGGRDPIFTYAPDSYVVERLLSFIEHSVGDDEFETSDGYIKYSRGLKFNIPDVGDYEVDRNIILMGSHNMNFNFYLDNSGDTIIMQMTFCLGINMQIPATIWTKNLIHEKEYNGNGE